MTNTTSAVLLLQKENSKFLTRVFRLRLLEITDFIYWHFFHPSCSLIALHRTIPFTFQCLLEWAYTGGKWAYLCFSMQLQSCRARAMLNSDRNTWQRSCVNDSHRVMRTICDKAARLVTVPSVQTLYLHSGKQYRAENREKQTCDPAGLQHRKTTCTHCYYTEYYGT